MNFKRLSTLAAGGALAVALVACGSSTPAASSASSTSAAMTSAAMTSAAMSSPAMTSAAMSSGDMTSGDMSSGDMSSGDMSSSAPMSSDSAMMSSGAEMSGDMVGSGCAAYAAANPSGAGSVEGMGKDKVATAASNNPLLTTLVAAVSGKINPKVNLVDTLNGGEFTVFAPVDDAFKADVDAATLAKLKTDDALLSKILTYHVIAGQLSPDQIVGTHKTVEGQDLVVTGSGNDLKVNGTAVVVCGGVKTANATVYLIDHVLMPPAA